jgi:hypothetical protein
MPCPALTWVKRAMPARAEVAKPARLFALGFDLDQSAGGRSVPTIRRMTGRADMTHGETLYLALVIVVAVTFAVLLAWGSQQTRKE